MKKQQKNQDNFTPIDQQNDIPHQFFCPISKIIMTDPVITCDGYTYEKQSIQKWLKQKKTNPLTNQALANTSTIQNRALKQSIDYFKQKGNKMNQTVKNLIDKQYQYLRNTIPELLNDDGLIDMNKVIRIAIQNTQLRKAITDLKQHLQKISQTDRFQKPDPRPCTNCIKFKQHNQKLQNIIKLYSHIFKSPSMIHKLDTEVKTFNYFPLSTQFLKKIDFRLIKQKDLSLQIFKSYKIQNLSLTNQLQRIKQIQKIPTQHIIRLWRVNIPITYILKKIQQYIENQPCTYIQKIKQFGIEISNLKSNIQSLQLKNNQYLIIQHGLKGQMVFTNNLTKCEYCYQNKQQKYMCKACQKPKFCSFNCAIRGSQFHLSQCSSSQIIPIQSR